MEIEVYYEKPEPVELDRELVAETTDIATLQRWYDLLKATESEVATMIGALRLADSTRLESMARKLGFTRIAINWIGARMVELGGAPVADKQGQMLIKLRQQITSLNQSMTTKNAKIAALQARIKELEP